MKQNNRSKFLRLKNRLYVNLLVFLGMISFSFIWGCVTNNDRQKDQQQIDDSIVSANNKQDSLQKLKADSTALAIMQKSKLDSIAREDSIVKAKKRHRKQYKPPDYPQAEYGIPSYNRD
jgi:hypothetical protein